MADLKIGRITFTGKPQMHGAPRPVPSRPAPLPPQDSADRLREIVARQDRAIDAALDAFARLSKTGSLKKEIREAAMKELVEARNERLRTEQT